MMSINTKNQTTSLTFKNRNCCGLFIYAAKYFSSVLLPRTILAYHYFQLLYLKCEWFPGLNILGLLQIPPAE